MPSLPPSNYPPLLAQVLPLKLPIEWLVMAVHQMEIGRIAAAVTHPIAGCACAISDMNKPTDKSQETFSKSSYS
jgi:hypothetical protein